MKEPIIAQFMLPITTKETVQELMQKGVDWGKTIGAIEELEKIKAEMMDEMRLHQDGDYYININDFYKVVNNHISELKGETE